MRTWNNSVKLYHELNGGELWGRIKLVRLPDDKDIADLRGEIKDEYYHIKNNGFKKNWKRLEK